MKSLNQLLAFFVTCLYRLWCGSLRYTVIGREAPDAHVKAGKPLVYCLWHDEMFALMPLRKDWPIITIVSQSKDGELLAGVLKELGLEVARGSSSRGGLRALLQMAKRIRSGQVHGCITVDGPRGPRHEVKEGAIFLAKTTPARIVPIRIVYNTAKRFASWDKFQLPMPFSRVYAVFGEPYALNDEQLTPESAQAACRELQEKLENLVPKDLFPRNNDSLRYRLYAFFSRQLQRLSLRRLHCLAHTAAFFCWHLLPSRRRTATAAIAKHLRVPEHEARRIARQSFDENFASFFEIFYAKRLYESNAVAQLKKPPLLEQLYAETGPVIVATAHIGSWELLEPYAAAFSRAPARDRLVVVRGQRDEAMDRIMLELRSESGLIAIGHREASRRVSHALKNNGFTAFLVDHNCSRKEAVFLPFLEDIAAVNVGPALLALRAKAVVYPVFLLRDGMGGHFLHMEPPLRTADLEGSINERATIIAQHYTDAVAKAVRAYPAQWFWMHQRWKTRP